MITRDEAVERARAYLSAQGLTSLPYAEGTRPNPTQDLWIVEHQDSTGALIEGGDVLVVPSEGTVRVVSFHPAMDELVGIQSPAEFAGVPATWASVLDDHLEPSFWWDLMSWVDTERAEHEVYPNSEQVFAAMHLTGLDDVRVVILGQDPYPSPGQAHGLSFSVPPGVRKPASLRKIHRLLQTDLSITPPDSGDLTGWARQGVLLLNTALTVRHRAPGSHADRWKDFTTAVVEVINEREEKVVFVLWGGHARSFKTLIKTSRHGVVEAAHPTARANARDPYLDSRSFSKVNQLLATGDRRAPIDWADTGP